MATVRKTLLQFPGGFGKTQLVLKIPGVNLSFSDGISTFHLNLTFYLHHYPAVIDFPQLRSWIPAGFNLTGNVFLLEILHVENLKSQLDFKIFGPG